MNTAIKIHKREFLELFCCLMQLLLRAFLFGIFSVKVISYEFLSKRNLPSQNAVEICNRSQPCHCGAHCWRPFWQRLTRSQTHVTMVKKKDAIIAGLLCHLIELCCCLKQLLPHNLLQTDCCKIVTNVLQTSQDTGANISANNATMEIWRHCCDVLNAKEIVVWIRKTN